MSTTEPRNPVRTVAAPHDALAGPLRRMGPVLLDGVPGGMRIVRAIAARIEINLGVGSTDGAEDQRHGDE